MPEAVSTRPSTASEANQTAERRLKSRRRRDRTARWIVSAAGMAIIAVILGILVFIAYEAWPLVEGAHVADPDVHAIQVPSPEVFVPNEHLEVGMTLSPDGVLRLVDVRSGAVTGRWDALTGRPLASETAPPDGRPLSGIRKLPGFDQLAAATSDGRVVIIDVKWREWFEGDTRRVDARPPKCVLVRTHPGGKRLDEFAARVDPNDGTTIVAGFVAGEPLHVVKRLVEVNELTEEEEESLSRHEIPVETAPDHLIVDKYQKNLFGAAGNTIHWWQLDRLGKPDRSETLTVPGAPVTALSFLKADVSLLVGHEDGEISLWFQIEPEEGADREMRRIRGHEHFGRQGAAIRTIIPSPRNKGFMALDAKNGLGLYYSTSERIMWKGEAPVAEPRAITFAPKDNGLFVLGNGNLAFHHIENEHPDAGWKAFFGKVHYENSPEPAFVWQSSSGDDDYENKFSLVPIIMGTLKGTFFSLLFAVPLAVLAALYASQFLHPTLREKIKPAIEIMAALPSVVLGFIAGLWLAPRMNAIVPGVLAMVIVMPVFMILGGWTWSRFIPVAYRRKVRPGVEIAWQSLFIVIGGWVCVLLNAPIQNMVFDGDFAIWMTQSAGLRYDQQNAIVVSVAMGFAVIPIIFTISEEAFSSVPRNLPLGSLALGATQWQTVVRIVVPSASPGVFSATMVGFGRAVGETMIVLMAAGNTPIMNWNPFEGFRTLSANIATEIPEAPQGETLYRTLFLAAMMLFVLTFAVNTIAEVVRSRLRKRYASL